MTAESSRGYRFSTEAQWGTCLFDRADRGSAPARTGLRPVAPLAAPPARYDTGAAGAPAVTRPGELLWRDGTGTLYRLWIGDEGPRAVTAPAAIARAARLVATPTGLWARGPGPGSVECFAEDTLTRLFVVDIADSEVKDLANGGHDQLLALVKHTRDRPDEWRSVRIDCTGRIIGMVRLQGVSAATALAYLPGPDALVVLADEPPQRLYWFSAADGTALRSAALATLIPCLVADAIGSDPRGRLLVAGHDGMSGGAPRVLVLDAEGRRLQETLLDASDAPATGIAATRDGLIVTGPRGLLRFVPADRVPDPIGELSAVVVTPALVSPDRQDGRRWLRVEVEASLAAGTALEIAVAATDDPEVRQRLDAIAATPGLPAGERLRQLSAEPDLWRAPTVFHGSDAAGDAASRSLAAPLFDVRERYLWVSLTLSAAAGARLPAVSELTVRYPGRSLMDNLPAIYRRAEAAPGSFLRALVGVLETTTQGLDARIAALGSQVHPATAPPAWLDFVARWLGLPWDDALEEGQKRALASRAAELAGARGTRAGLEALLECLIPGDPRRFRIEDPTAERGFAMVGNAAGAGSVLPALLAAHPPPAAELNARAVLGRVHLPCADTEHDATAGLAGTILVLLAAPADQRRALEPCLPALIEQMVPVTTRVTLRWVSLRALRGARLDERLTLESGPEPHLGTDAVAGLVRLPHRRQGLSATGPDIGTHLY